jgi:Tfp pilus assembly ATPase PilU
MLTANLNPIERHGRCTISIQLNTQTSITQKLKRDTEKKNREINTS